MKNVFRRTIIPAVLLSSFAPSVRASAAAPELTEVVTRVVRFADLDITTAPGATALYGRIVSAARLVCREAQPSTASACRASAVARGVADVGSALLTAIHRSNEAEEVARH
jgi:UrcA family protein